MNFRAENCPPATLSVASTMPERARHEAGVDRDVASRERFSVLGVAFDAVQIPDVINQMQRWITQRQACRYIAVAGMHGITEARHNAEFRKAVADADLVVADGMPVVWLGRLRGHFMPRRVYGPELMLRFCKETALAGYRHYLLGGAPGVPEQLARSIEKVCSGITIVGTHSPPFRASTSEEDAELIENINRAAPDVLWVGLGTPKQEVWMRRHRDKLRVPVIIGVGAAFDFLSFRKRQAPVWMQERGLEWLFRLFQEPRRLWKRYSFGGFEFLFLVTLELLGWRRSSN
jgi:N-acetylglucosaminyldiphosphoundecaprenol N-acetyl-beta-D-mannosaminyltransferase